MTGEQGNSIYYVEEHSAQNTIQHALAFIDDRLKQDNAKLPKLAEEKKNKKRK